MRTQLDEANIRGKTYRVGDRIDLYKADIGFQIVRIDEVHYSGRFGERSEVYLTVKRPNGRVCYTWSSGWIGTTPQWKPTPTAEKVLGFHQKRFMETK